MSEPYVGIVNIVRDFLVAYRLCVRIFERYAEGALRFEDIVPLVGEDESSVLYRLKESCHRRFRGGTAQRDFVMRREALFDLGVGSLFHEAMRLRESLYQQEIYVPRLDALMVSQGEEAGLFAELKPILARSGERLADAIDETRQMLQQTRNQLRLLLAEETEGGLIARCLYEQEEAACEVFEVPFDTLLAEIYGDPARGYQLAADSYLDSAHFSEALAVLASAPGTGAADRGNQGRIHYATGMQAFLARNWAQSVEHLARWLDAGVDPIPRQRVQLAHDAISRLENLVEPEEEASLRGTAKALADRMQILLGGEDAESAFEEESG